MKIKSLAPLILLLLFSCSTENDAFKEIRKDFTKEEEHLIKVSKEIINKAYFATFITNDSFGNQKARVMEPFEPDENFVIWLATNPKSRKVKELSNNSFATLHYFDTQNTSYVSLIGKAFLVDDDKIKSQKFKKGWDRFYKNQKEDYILIKFIPTKLELISVPNNLAGDSITWKPHGVQLRSF